MSSIRQVRSIDEADLLARSLSLRLPAPHRIGRHAHDWVQLVHVSHGAIAVEAERTRWSLTPDRCLVVPAGTAHSVETIRSAWMRTVYLPPATFSVPLQRVQLFGTSPLRRELIAEAVRLGVLQRSDRVHGSIATLLADSMPRVADSGLMLTLPTDARALRLARLVIAEPGDSRPLSELARLAHASPRTLERLFRSETGVSFGQWHQTARMQHAVRLLAEGSSVSDTAYSCGYGSSSAFVAAFRQALGVTPGKFAQAQHLASGASDTLDC